jgi:alpha-L-arabinofuranosidase
VHAYNTFEEPDRVTARTSKLSASGSTLTLELEPHSVTVLRLPLRR